MNTKLVLIVIVCFLFVAGFISAQGQVQQIHQEVQSQEENQLTATVQQQQLFEQKLKKVQERIQEKRQVIKKETENMEGEEKEVAQNQNQIRIAVHSLLEMEGVIGGIGSKVSKIAREVDNSLQSAKKAELKISNRNVLVRFFMGGDKEATQELKNHIEQNRERIQELYKLREDCDCQEEVKNMFQEQIREMGNEQERLERLAEKENQSKGLFGWLFGWLR
jgi:hypothetical protein